MKKPSPSRILSSCKTESFLVTNRTNIRYLTGFDGSAGVVLVHKRHFHLFVDGRYIEKATTLSARQISVHKREDLQDFINNIKTIGFESEHITVEQLRLMKRKFKNKKFVQKIGIVEEFRRQKTAEELKYFTKAQSITKKIMKRVPKALKRGITEKALAHSILTWALDLGADGLSFDPIVAYGSNSSLPHHHPTDRKLKKGDIVQIDCGARYKGYCADRSEVFCFGAFTQEQKSVYACIKKAKDTAKKMAKAGKKVADLDKAAREVLAQENLEQYFVHSLGHGVGLDIHEGVTLSTKSKDVLRKNEIITIEPGVYIPGKWGMRLEEEFIV